MVKEAVEEAKNPLLKQKEAETDTDETTETSEKVENRRSQKRQRKIQKRNLAKNYLARRKKDKKTRR